MHSFSKGDEVWVIKSDRFIKRGEVSSVTSKLVRVHGVERRVVAFSHDDVYRSEIQARAALANRLENFARYQWRLVRLLQDKPINCKETIS